MTKSRGNGEAEEMPRQNCQREKRRLFSTQVTHMIGDVIDNMVSNYCYSDTSA